MAFSSALMSDVEQLYNKEVRTLADEHDVQSILCRLLYVVLVQFVGWRHVVISRKRGAVNLVSRELDSRSIGEKAEYLITPWFVCPLMRHLANISFAWSSTQSKVIVK